MIITIDVETQGLDCTQYITGCLIQENKKEPLIFRDKKRLWNYILELGEKESRRGKMLNVYSHNATYDFYAYADLKDENLKWFSHKPFIVAYMKEGKEIIKFLDLWSIYRMSLESVGKIIGLEKQETPEELKTEEKREYSDEELKEIEGYMIRDTEIVMEAIKRLKKKLKDEGIKIRRLYTINQIAIQYLLTELRKELCPQMFWNADKGETRRTFRAEEIHKAYRGGRVECFKTGVIEDVSMIDVNSLYPYSAMRMRFPDLRTERKRWRPEEKEWEEIIKMIGLSKCVIKNESNQIGLLPIRTPTGSYYPKENKYIIGVWTHTELEEAVKEGYKIINIEWSVTYEDADNPLIKVMEKLYNQRIKSGNEIDKWFYKQMMNNALGKLAQTRVGQEIVIDSVEKAEEYLQMGHKILKGIDLNYMYKKENKGTPMKKYYTPIIPTLVNAYARVFMYKQFKKFKKEQLIYTDTDSIMFKGECPKEIEIGKEIGQFKVENVRDKAIIWGRKTYSIGKNIKISGIRRNSVKKEDFEEGYIKDKKMITINTTKKIEEVGKFKEEGRDLKTQLENHKETEKMFMGEVILMDSNIEDIVYFTKDLNSILS